MARWSRWSLSIAILPAILISGLTVTILGEETPVRTGNKRVDKLLAEMTLEEKLSMIHGAMEDPSEDQGEAGYLPGVPRLAIPAMRFADGPPGVLTRIPSTAPTATMGLAATFSKEDARQNGVLIGREAKSHGIDVVLEPFINIDRDTRFSRSYNTFGEDPCLTGQIGAAEIQGIQGEGVMAQAKHYVAYDSDGGVVAVDQRALREIYIAPFADALNAGVSSIMCSYNQVNGQYACGNADTLSKILRDEVGFQGFVTSDWGATHANTFINAGLDLEMPGPRQGEWPAAHMPSYFDDGPELPPLPPQRDASPNSPSLGIPEEPITPSDDFPMRLPGPVKNMKDALRSGLVTEATITRAVARVLLQMDRFGLLDKHTPKRIMASDSAGNSRIIEKTGEDAAVLLKNDRGILPLRPSDLVSLAFIGPGAGQTVAVGMAGEKAVGLPERQVGTADIIKKSVADDPSEHVTYSVADDMTGTPIPFNVLSHNGQPGLERTSEKTQITLVDPEIDFTRLNGKALSNDSSYRWKGNLNIPYAGRYRLYLQVLGAFSSLRLDGKELAANGKMDIHGDITQAGQDNVLPTTDGLDNLRRELDLAAGNHALEIAVSPDLSHNPVQVRLNWVTPEQQKADYKAAIAAAAEAKMAVVFAWSRGQPDFGLPGDQDRLIEDIAAVSPNTIVVLNVSLPVAMPWLNKVRAVLQMWWPGDEGGFATANILMGKTNPAGRLPFTWPRRLEDMAVEEPGHPERSGKGFMGTTTFSESILVGYRWFDARNIQPLFPFGFGLSYSHFEYSALTAKRTQDGGFEVSFDLRNVGKFAGDEVAQVYLGAPKDPQLGETEFAVRSLVAFDRITLDPGQTRRVTLHVPFRYFQYWSRGSGRWTTATGERWIFVGASSRDLRLSTIVNATK